MVGASESQGLGDQRLCIPAAREPSVAPPWVSVDRLPRDESCQGMPGVPRAPFAVDSTSRGMDGGHVGILGVSAPAAPGGRGGEAA